MDERFRCQARAKQSGEQCKRAKADGANVCIIHGARGGRPITSASRECKVTKQSLSERIREFIATCDPLDPTYALATQAVLLQDIIQRFAEAGAEPPAESIDRLVSWSESHVRSITRVIDARNKSALTAAEIQLVAVRLAQLADEFVDPERHEDFFKRISANITCGALPVSSITHQGCDDQPIPVDLGLPEPGGMD